MHLQSQVLKHLRRYLLEVVLMLSSKQMLGLLAHLQRQQSMCKVDVPLQTSSPLHLAVDQSQGKATHLREKQQSCCLQITRCSWKAILYLFQCSAFVPP